MYRPNVFYTVNTSVWDGFPMNGDGTNVPPALCMDGYGIWGLYNLHAKK
jgi:peptide/nickel transport system substrate-binding protein